MTETRRAASGTTVIATGEDTETEKELTEIESGSTGAGQPSRGTQGSPSNARFNASGHKSTDRKTGVAQSDEHYSWRQVYRLCAVDGYAHE